MNLSLPCVGAALALGCASSVDGAHASDAGVIDVGASDVPLGPIPGCPAAQGPRGRWASVALPDDFAAREDPAALSAGDALIVYGGRGERTDLSDAWRYLPRTDRWERLPDSGLAGPARALAVAWVAARGELFVWSGFRRVGARWSASAGWRPLPTAGAPTSFATRAVVAATPSLRDTRGMSCEKPTAATANAAAPSAKPTQAGRCVAGMAMTAVSSVKSIARSRAARRSCSTISSSVRKSCAVIGRSSGSLASARATS